MDTKEIVDKVLKGEDFPTLLKGVPQEKQAEVSQAVMVAIDAQVKSKKGEVDAATKDLISVRKGIEDIKEKNAASVAPVLDQFKKEQLQKAKNKFFNDPKYPVSAEQKILIENEITNKGIQSTDSDFIFDEIKRIYGALNVDTLIEAKEKAAAGARGAASFNANGAAAGGNTGPAGDPDKYSQGVRDLWQAVVKSGHANFTLEQAKEQFEKGRNSSKRILA